MNIQGIVYVIINQLDGKQYVGQTKTHKKIRDKWYKYGITQRFTEHVGSARRERTTPIATAINSNGADMFLIDEIERCDLSELNARESHYIKKYNTLVPNGYNVQKQSGQVVEDGCLKVTLKGISRNGMKSLVRAYIKYPNHTDRLSFHGETFSEAIERARIHFEQLDSTIVCEHSSLKENTALWWPYKEKIDQFNNRQVNRIRVSLFGTQNLIRVEVRTDEMKSWKEQVRLVFGGKKIQLNDALATALAVVTKIETIHRIQHSLDPRLSAISQSLQQAAAN